MSTRVKGKRTSAAQLRAICAVNFVRYAEVARRLGRSLSWVSLTLNEKRPAAPGVLEQIAGIVQGIISEQRAGRSPLTRDR
jgi:hypothetical protein